MSLKEIKNKGNKFYGAGQWKEAIEEYTKAIELEPKNHVLYAIRSACYLKKMEYEKVITDADMCICLKPDFDKGYGWKGAAYHAMNEYDKAIEVYVKGLTECSEMGSLVKGLNAVKRAKLSKGKCSKIAMSARMARKNASERAAEAKLAEDVESFIEIKRRELNLLMLSLQNQLDLLDDLKNMKDADKMETLFYLVDLDGDGFVSAVELASAIHHLSSDLSLRKGAEKVVERVEEQQREKEQAGEANPMKSEEFTTFMNFIAKEMNTNMNDLIEFMVLQILFEDPRAPSPVQKEEEAKPATGEEEKVEAPVGAEANTKKVRSATILQDPRTATLFDLFDKDGDGLLSFPEVAIGLYHICDKSMKKSAKTAHKLLLALDKDDKRTLNIEQFGRLLMAATAASGLSYEQIMDTLLIELGKDTELTPKDFTALLAFSKEKDDEDKDRKDKDVKDTDKNAESFTRDRLEKLFHLWDEDSDGFLSHEEVEHGLEYFKRALGQKGATKEAAVLLKFDDDKQRLDLDSFCKAMTLFSQASKVKLRELIDFMCVTSVLGSGDHAVSFREAYATSVASSVDGNAAPKLPPLLEVPESELPDPAFFI